MKIKLNEIYKSLDEWRAERGITAESQKVGYLVNVMEEFGELSQALRDYEKIKKGEQVKKKIVSDWYIADNNIYSNSPAQYITLADAARELIKYKEVTLADAEHEIIDALCNISVLTINAGMELPCEVKPLIIVLKDEFSVADIFVAIADFIRTDANGSPFNYYDFARILNDCAGVCGQYGFNYEIAMLETIKHISSNTGKEYKAKADYEKAKIKDTKQGLNDMKQTMKR